MNGKIVRLIPLAAAALMGGLIVAAPATAQTRPPVRDVCVSVDEAHDTLSSQERAAARLLLAKQFDLEGWHVVPEGCPAPYTVAHVQLGNRITVTLSGPNRQLEGAAFGLDDLPALYSQMVRAMVTGRPMTGMNVIDRTNVTAAQAQPARRVTSDSFGYARLGYGSGGPGLGFGHRAEGDTLAIDVSFLNFQQNFGSSSPGYYSSGGGASWSWVKLEGLFFENSVKNASAYYGGGISWGGAYSRNANSWTSWQGSGLQGELTAGYEVGRASTLRVFVQADATLPFYQMTSSSTGGSRYSSSLVISVGLGWQRGRR
jgi:hypothetical protein